MSAVTITSADVTRIGRLANLTLSSEELTLFADQFSKTIGVISQLNEIDTSKLSPTSSVSHLENVTREDEVDMSRVLSQQEALSGAKRTHRGFFVVDQVLTKDD